MLTLLQNLTRVHWLPLSKADLLTLGCFKGKYDVYCKLPSVGARQGEQAADVQKT